MPELPDLTLYQEALATRIVGEPIERIRIQSPSLLRTVTPTPQSLEGRMVRAVDRIGKRIVLRCEGELCLVLHLMVAGRLHWKPRTARLPRKTTHAAFDFPRGSLHLTEAGTRKRASLHVVAGEAALRALDPGGLEVLDATADAFRAALLRERHTLKRALTDPHLFAGIGNAYSDEILHRARLSPVKLTDRLAEDEIARLFEATRDVLTAWIDRLRAQTGDAFPEKVTAFRPEMAVHGRFREPCPVCGAPVQRIVRAENEANYCATCQTSGRVLADRALSKLLRGDWPRTLEELERRRPDRNGPETDA
ncbi:MAG: DNA-formamidopyrimidine glycosylase family protein [Myxococcota bacterium]